MRANCPDIIIVMSDQLEYTEQNDDSPIRDDQSEALTETLAQMRDTVHNLKLQDAIHRQEIRKLERSNKKLEGLDSADQAKKLAELEKQKAVDEQYLMKQQELIV